MYRVTISALFSCYYEPPNNTDKMSMYLMEDGTTRPHDEKIIELTKQRDSARECLSGIRSLILTTDTHGWISPSQRLALMENIRTALSLENAK